MTAINLLSQDLCHKQPSERVCFVRKNKLIILMLTVSILLHAMALVKFGDSTLKTTIESTSRHLMVSLSTITPEAPPETQRSKPESKPRPIQKTPERVSQTHHPAEKMITENDVSKVEAGQQMAQNQPQPTQLDPALLRRTRDEYLQVLAAHIDKHKFYPRSARRRHIEGEVRVSFDLLTNGRIVNLHTFSGHSILQRATSDSIHSAVPMPPRPQSLLALNTMKIEYSMLFSLK